MKYLPGATTMESEARAQATCISRSRATHISIAAMFCLVQNLTTIDCAMAQSQVKQTKPVASASAKPNQTKPVWQLASSPAGEPAKQSSATSIHAMSTCSFTRISVEPSTEESNDPPAAKTNAAQPATPQESSQVKYKSRFPEVSI